MLSRDIESVLQVMVTSDDFRLKGEHYSVLELDLILEDTLFNVCIIVCQLYLHINCCQAHGIAAVATQPWMCNGCNKNGPFSLLASQGTLVISRYSSHLMFKGYSSHGTLVWCHPRRNNDLHPKRWYPLLPPKNPLQRDCDLACHKMSHDRSPRVKGLSLLAP